jgi:hypothetical protein
MNGHPSQYALDRAALGGPVDAAMSAHLDGCGRCAAIVAERREAPSASPAWLDRVKVSGAPRPPWWRRLRWVLPIPAVAALAALLAVVALPRRSAETVREKGAPAVALYVKRGDAVSAWDGKSTIRPGDRLRVGVRGSGFAQVSVASVSPGGEPTVLYSGPVDRVGETLLPLSFRVEGAGATEVLSVALGARPIAPEEHVAPPGSRSRAGTWVIRLHIPKEESR